MLELQTFVLTDCSHEATLRTALIAEQNKLKLKINL